MSLDLAKETKATLALRIDALTLERDRANAAANNLLVVANNFAKPLSNIEQLLVNAPFIQKGFFKKLWWVITNWKQLAQLIEDIIAHIQEWKAYVESLKNAQIEGDQPTLPVNA